MPVHNELIENHSFINKFRDYLRNYYTYGFMKYNGDLSTDWKRLNNVLQKFAGFDRTGRYDGIRFISTDSQSLPYNPFHRVYRFCMYKPAFQSHFFNIMLTLSGKYKLNRELYQTPDKPAVPPALWVIDEERKKELEERKKKISRVMTTVRDKAENADYVEKVTFLPSELEQFKARIDFDCEYGKPRSMTVKELNVFCHQGFFTEPTKLLKTESRTFRNYLPILSEMGILESQGKSPVTLSLNPVTLSSLISVFQKKTDTDHFFYALEFFSRYAFLGEFGIYLLSRWKKQPSGIFRFRHDYIAQALGDYHKITLLQAIETKRFCRIICFKPIGDEEERRGFLCMPLQIRTSQTSGREYLAYYEPFQRAYRHVRIDFIDKIQILDAVYQDGQQLDPVPGAQEPNPAQETVARDIERAKAALSQSWGVSAASHDLDKITTYPVELTIRYDPKTEHYILNRMYHERRIGEITEVDAEAGLIRFRINVSDVQEMHPWIRSLYTRIVSLKINGNQDFPIAEDIEKIRTTIPDDPETDAATSAPQKKTVSGKAARSEKASGSQEAPEKPKKRAKPFIRWEIPDHVTGICGGKEIDLTEQKGIVNSSDLFDPIYGIYSMIQADVLTKLYAPGKEKLLSFTEAEVENKIEAAIAKRSSEAGSQTKNNMTTDRQQYHDDVQNALLRDGSLRRCEGQLYPKFRCAEAETPDLYRDLIPLTTWEMRWLRTILDDPKMELFLKPETIQALKTRLKHVAPFQADAYCCFDRYHQEPQPEALAALTPEHFSKLYHALFQSIRSFERAKAEKAAKKVEHYALHNLLFLSYLTMKGKVRRGCFQPLHIDYSKRDDKFRLYACLKPKDPKKPCRIVVINIDRILTCSYAENVVLTEQELSAAQRKFDRKIKSVTICFKNERNIPDRILSELSPWKKECIYDSETGIFTLTVYYHKNDEVELTIRIMGYGKGISFADPQHAICTDIRERLSTQLELTSRTLRPVREERV